MKKFLCFVVLGLLWSSFGFADVEKILKGYNKTNISEWLIKEAEIIVRQVSQDLLHILEGTDLKDVEKEIERLQQSLIS